jgi:hypothetical protein
MCPPHYGLLAITGKMASSPFFQPGTQVSGVAIWIVGHASLGHQENAGKFRSQFLLCVVEISKPV